MTLEQITALSTLKEMGMDDWSFEQQPIKEAVQVRTDRRLIVAHPDVPYNELPTMILTELNTRRLTEHPGWEAYCPKCDKRFLRSKPTTTQHYCSACGPEEGRLEFR